MLDQYQRSYAANNFTANKYKGFIQQMNSLMGMVIEYRICEMAAFVSNSFQSKLEEASISIVEECVQAEYLVNAAPALQPRYTVPNQHAKPMFSTVDFAVTQNPLTGEFEPKLIELQGFPSLFGYQYVYSQEARKWFDLDPRLHFVLSGKSEDEYVSTMRRVLLGADGNGSKASAPENVVLLEYKPEIQKTLPDFICTERLWGVRATDICSVKKEGRKLFYQRDGIWTPIERIYNRAIVDELDDNNVELPFAWTDDLDVEWVGHPNWYFLMSKFSMPYLKHKSVPKTYFLDQLTEIPTDIENYVLKPLFAFAGKGVNVNPTRADVEAVPSNERPHWILQERVHYAECIYTPEGMNKGEIRILLVWLPDEPRPVPLVSLFRTGRGPMMGARFNKIPWTGTSSCFFGSEEVFG